MSIHSKGNNSLIDMFFDGNYRVLESQRRVGIRIKLFRELVKKILILEGFKFQEHDNFDFIIDNSINVKLSLNINYELNHILESVSNLDGLVIIYLDKVSKSKLKSLHKKVNVDIKMISVYKYFSKASIKKFRKEISKIVEYKGWID